MHYTVTTLVDNAVAPSGKALLGEHGLSFYIEDWTILRLGEV